MIGQNSSQWNFGIFLDDVLYSISFFLDSRTILYLLRFVNKRFYEIFSDLFIKVCE
jgi:hypothetical protein